MICTKENWNMKIKIPNITTVPESTLVNFTTLAESEALAPSVDLRTSTNKLSLSPKEVDIFNLLTSAILFGLLVLWTSSCIKV